MDLSEMVRKQIEADERRGFTVEFETENERIDQLMREIVGLVGEVGEFSNALKKVSLSLTTSDYRGPSLSEASPHLREELADAAIYIFRLSTILHGDLERDILAKMRVNDERYRHLEK